jgi:hypothetical protein
MNEDRESKFWNYIERSSNIAQIASTLVVIFPLFLAGINIVREGLNSVVPSWTVFISTISALLLGFFIGRRRFSQNQSRRKPIKTIGFNYQEPFTQHGWELFTQDPNKIKISHVSDGFLGKVLEIKAEAQYAYAMDYQVDSSAVHGRFLEFAAMFEDQAYVYSLVRTQSRDRSTSRELWLKFVNGMREPELVDSSKNSEEWLYYINPTRIEGNWLLFRVDLNDAVKRTIGRNGWHLNQLQKIRLRGDQRLAYISIYK